MSLRACSNGTAYQDSLLGNPALPSLSIEGLYSGHVRKLAGPPSKILCELCRDLGTRAENFLI